MDDLISRKAVIDALDALCDRECEYSKKQRNVMCGACHLGSAFDAVEQLPSAQSVEKDINVPCKDTISRQAVQEMVDRIGDIYPYRQIGNRDSYSQYNEAWTDAINRVDAELNSLPSTQSEIIRCKDCKWKQGSECVRFAEIRPFPNDFCSRAERRSDE